MSVSRLDDLLLVEIFKFIPLRKLPAIATVCHRFVNILFHDQQKSKEGGRATISNPSEPLIIYSYFWFLKFKEWQLNSSWKELNYYYHNFTSTRIDVDVSCVRENVWKKIIEKLPKNCKSKYRKLSVGNSWIISLLDDFYKKNPKINWKQIVYYLHSNVYENLMISQLMDDIVCGMNRSGYFTIGSCWYRIITEKDEPVNINQLNDAFFNDDRVLETIGQCLDNTPSSYMNAYRMQETLKMNFKPPSTWLCSYNRPRVLRIVWGCLKKVLKLLFNYKKMGKIRKLVTLQFISSIGYVISNDNFAIIFGGRSC